MTKPLVSVVVLSYNRPVALQRALVSVVHQTYPNLEVLVVDNLSVSSEEIARIVSRFPAIRLISHPGNLGFTGGMNSGIRAAFGKFVYLTEDDIEVEPQVITTLVEHLTRNPSMGVAGPVMVNRISGTVRCAGGHFTLGNTYQMRILDQDTSVERLPRTGPYSVSYLPGASMMVRAALFERLGSFRDEFFMYGEDVEFCARVRRSGLGIAVVPSARVIHDEPSADVPAIIEFHKIKNFVSLYLLHARPSVLPIFIVRYGAAGLVRALRERRGLLHLRAWFWALARAPRFLLERLQSVQTVPCTD